MSPVCGHCAKLCSNGDGVTLICLSPLQHTAHDVHTTVLPHRYTPLSPFTVPPGPPREKSSIDRPRDIPIDVLFHIRFAFQSKFREKSPSWVSKRVEPQQGSRKKQRQGKGLAFSRGPPIVHFLSVSLEFATISNLRVFVAGFLEVEVQWTSDDDLFESSRLDPGWFLWSLFFFLSIQFYWSEDVGDVSAHEYRRLNMRQFSSYALWFDMWT